MIENKLKDIIVSRYGSVKQFSEKINVPNSTVDTILKRGIAKANVLNVIKMCNELGFSVDSLKDNILQPTEIEKISREEFSNQMEILLRDTDYSDQQKQYIKNTIDIVNNTK